MLGEENIDIGANPSAEGGGDDEGVSGDSVKVVNLINAFRLQVGRPTLLAPKLKSVLRKFPACATPIMLKQCIDTAKKYLVFLAAWHS